MPSAEIKIRAFVWQERFEDFDGKTRVRNRQASRGDKVELDDHWFAYGETMGAFVTEADREEVAEDALATAETVEEMGPDELMDWVSESTIPQIMNVAKADTSLVSRIVDAENKGTGNDPRYGLITGLAHLVGSGDPEKSEDEPDVSATEEAVLLAQKLEVSLPEVAEFQGIDEDSEVDEVAVKEFFDEKKANATDGARALADEEDVYLADVTGSGDDGRISKDDVQKYLDDLSEDDEDEDEGDEE